MPCPPNTQLVLPGLSAKGDPAAVGWRAGDRVKLILGSATGTIERLQDEVADVRWDTGARCPVPLAWLGEPQQKQNGHQTSAARKRRHATAAWKRDHSPRRCNGCGKVFRPTRADQVFCTATCRKRAHRNGSVPAATKAVASRDSRTPPAVTAARVCVHCGAPLASARSDARYCGAACRKAAQCERERAAS
jgi:predicted nucleic acid-binding Zn ribbon protein